METTEEKKRPIEIILTEYETFLKEKKMDSFKIYLSVENAFTLEEVFDNCNNKNAARNFLDLLPKLIKNNKIEMLRSLTQEILSARKGLNLTRSKQSKSSYISKFLIFIEEKIISPNGDNLRDKFQKEFDSYNLTLTDKDIAVLNNDNNNKEYLQDQLRTKFKSRLRTQDRVSGDKIWLPLRFIAKLYNPEGRNNNINNNAYLKWLNDLSNNIYIHYEEIEKRTKFINSSKLSKIESLVLEAFENDTFKVKVIKNGTKYQVLTPTGKSNEKEYMIVNDIKDIAIDHVKPIDKTLRELEQTDELPMLKKVSDLYRDLQENELLDEKDAVGMLQNDESFDLFKLTDELYKISRDGPLRLMTAKYNSQKSNGDTFKKILNINGIFWGVLEDKIYNKCAKKPTKIICQKLDNTKTEGGKIRILNNVDIEKYDFTEKFKWEENINCI